MAAVISQLSGELCEMNDFLKILQKHPVVQVIAVYCTVWTRLSYAMCFLLVTKIVVNPYRPSDAYMRYYIKPPLDQLMAI